MIDNEIIKSLTPTIKIKQNTGETPVFLAGTQVDLSNPRVQ
jgi:hypothetical protein